MNGEKLEYCTKDEANLLEQYKLYVEMADRVSQRRMEANKFFISVHTFIVTVVSLFSKGNHAVLILIALLGIVFSSAWYVLLKSYRQLNSGKFKVIHEMETKLPFAAYDMEWDKLGRGKDRKRYWPISHLEVVLPIIMGTLYFGFLLYILYCIKTGLAITLGPIQE